MITLTLWFDASRYCYNKTIEYLKQKDTKSDWKAIKGWMLKELPERFMRVPFHIKVGGIQDACRAVTNAKVKYKQSGVFNEVGFRSRKSHCKTLHVESQNCPKPNTWYCTYLGELRSAESFEVTMGGQFRLQNGRYYMVINRREPVKTPDTQGRVVAIDPGIRSFTTFYSPEGCGKIGVQDFNRFQRLCVHLDALYSKIKLSKSHQQKQKIAKAIRRQRQRIEDLRFELHHKAAKFYVDNFDVIFIPKFRTSEMVVKSARCIRKKSVRNMLTFGHYVFRQILIDKALSNGKSVFEMESEAYTSKTCSWNGVIKSIGGAKWIRDNGIVVDRDYNGARGIFLRALRDTATAL